MDDQEFGGRTDDDLFADDFEPLESVEPAMAPDVPAATVQAAQTAETVQSGVAQTGDQALSSSPGQIPATAPAKGASGRRARSSRAKANGGASKAPTGDVSQSKQQQPQKPTNNHHPQAPAPETHTAPPPPSLAQSRHYQPPQPAATPAVPLVAVVTSGGQQKKGRNGQANGANGANREAPPRKRENGPSSAPAPNGGGGGMKAGQQQKPEAAIKKPNGRAKAGDAPKAVQGPGKGAAPNGAAKPNGARTQSGANPRSKLTEAELNAKMEAMRIASAEKARLFEKAQRDELDHERAVARGMEEARKRKMADEERRKRAVEEDKRRRAAQETRAQDEERARNRERKLKALGAKEGNWDAGKDGSSGSKPPPPPPASGMQASRHAPAAAPASLPTEPGASSKPNYAAVTAAPVPPPSNFTQMNIEKHNAVVGGYELDEWLTPINPPNKQQRRGPSTVGRGNGRGGGGGGGGRGNGRRGGRLQFDDVYGNGADVADWVKNQPHPSVMAAAVVPEEIPTPAGDAAAEKPAPVAAASPGPAKEARAATPEKAKVLTFSQVAAASPIKAPLPELQPVGDWADEVEEQGN